MATAAGLCITWPCIISQRVDREAPAQCPDDSRTVIHFYVVGDESCLDMLVTPVRRCVMLDLRSTCLVIDRLPRSVIDYTVPVSISSTSLVSPEA